MEALRSNSEILRLSSEMEVVGDLDAIRKDLLASSAFRFFPEALDKFLASAELKQVPGDAKVISEGAPSLLIFMSLDHRFERSMTIGNFDDRIFVSDVEPFEFVGVSDVLQKKDSLMSYSTQDTTTVLTVNRSGFVDLFQDEQAMAKFRLLNSSRALRDFFFYLQGHDIDLQSLFQLLDKIEPNPKMLEKRSLFEQKTPQMTFVQSGGITGLQIDGLDQKNFVFESGSWFGVGFAGRPDFQKIRLETIDTVYYHSLAISSLEAVLSPDLLLLLSSEPCLSQVSVSANQEEDRESYLPAKSLSLGKLRFFGFQGDVSQIRFGGFPFSPFHSTLWNFLVLFRLDLNESYISKIGDSQDSINLSQFASALEDVGLVTNLRRCRGGRSEVVPEKSLVYFYGRPAIFLKASKKNVFLLDPVHGLIAISEVEFFNNWNMNLVDVKRPALREVLPEDAKLSPEKSEQVGKSLLSFFLNLSADEFKNLITFRFFQSLVVLAVPSFLFGLVNQSIGKTSSSHIYGYYVGIGLFLIFQAVSSYSLNIYSGQILSSLKTTAQSYFYKLYLNSASNPQVPLRAGLVYTRMTLFDYAFSAMKFERTERFLYAFMLILFLLIIGSFSWQATFILGVSIFTALVLIYHLRKKGGFTEVNTALLRQEVIDSFVDIVHGFRSIRATHTMAHAENKLNSVVKQLALGSGEYSIGMIGLSQKGQLIFKIGGVLALYTVCKELVNHRSSPAELFGLTLYLSYLNSPFQGLSGYFTNFNTTGLFAVPGQLAMSQGFQRTKTLRTLSLKGSVQFDRVSYRYSERSPFSVIEASFKISPGERIAIVGRSGSGKSTLARLISRQIDPSSGKVLYDDVDSRMIEPASIQSQMGFVPQVPTMFAGSLVSNITYGDEEPQFKKTKDLCRTTHAHQFIKKLPGDYSYVMKEFGIGLSAGQKQIMALTRVLYSEPEVLVLDEVTAHLDPQAEGFITERIFERKQNRTTVMVVQKISAARRADRIFVMKQGRIIEEGDHNRLMLLGGEYSELYRHQVSDDL